MGLSGLVGSGAVKGLEDIITEQLLQAKAAEEQRRAQAQEALQQQRIDQQSQEHADMMGRYDRQDARVDERQQREDEQFGIDSLRQQAAAQAQRMGGLQDQADYTQATTDPASMTRIGRLGAISKIVKGAKMDDVLTPEERAAEAAAAESADLGKYRARKQIDLQYARPIGGDGGGKPQWLVRGGEVVQDSYKPGDKPYDAVQARNAVPSGGATEAADTAAEVARIATALRNHPGLPSAFGTLDSKIPTFRQSTADAEVLRDSLRSLLTLENMGKMKGVLSDADMRIIANASTTLNANMGDASARAELDRLIQVMGKASEGGGAAGPMPGPVPSHGAAAPGVRKFNPATGKLEPM